MSRDHQSRDSDDAAGSQRSIALKRALEELGRRWRPLVLDLGPARNSTLGFFSGQRCRLQVEDLGDALGGLPPPGEPLLSLDPEEPVDLVLAWDLFDHLEPEARSRLGREIVEHSRPGTMFLALVHTRHRMPPRPAAYSILADGARLLAEPAPGPERDAPELKEPDLRRLLPGYAVEASLLLRIGMQEYLMVYEGDPAVGGDAPSPG